MAKQIKSTAILFGGYLYQNLVGLEFLCNWLENPALYDWVKFEADDDGIPKGLDDIVARRKDGTLVLLQVKFTVDAYQSANALSWSWVLAHKPKGRSFVQKWADAFFSAGAEYVSDAALVTNRIPDREFAACLDPNGRIDVATIPKEIREQLLEQLGGEERATEFFGAFDIRHSQQGYVSLESTLRDRFIPRFTDSHGWLNLYREAIDWATRRYFPPPAGEIRLDIVRGILNSRRPEPLTQSFEIPDGYIPPDDEFTQSFIDRILSGSENVVVLWGSPGQGKSTFLSHVCSELDRQSILYVRHHYFLNLAEMKDRLSLFQVANSLMAQMESRQIEHVRGLRDSPEKLREWIVECARGASEEGNRFLVVIDGLDHVWRENERNRTPLDSLFQYLFPVPENVTLVIGTQKVSDEQLPYHFDRFVPDNCWVELPRMSLRSIKKWLQVQLDSETFDIPESNSGSSYEPLTDLARAFERLSGGHPLVLVYSFRTLAREERLLSADVVDGYSNRSNGDVNDYYLAMWKHLSFDAKDALHLIADAGFIWPLLGIELCLGVNAADLRREIGNLLFESEAGCIAFHGSILVFVRETKEHNDRVSSLLNKVIHWLTTLAPPYYRWGWLWIYQARLGSPENILTLTTREWVVSSLAKAYPDSQISAILSMAERIAFDSADYSTAVRIRWLKIRLQNGKEFQVRDYDRLYRCALRITDEGFRAIEVCSSLNTATIRELNLLGMLYVEAGNRAGAVECQELIRRRINDRIKARAYDNGFLENASKQYLELAAATGEYKPERIIKSILGFRGIATDLFQYFLDNLSKKMELRPLMEFVNVPLQLRMRKDLELTAIRIAGACHARIHEWPQFARFHKHPISVCWRFLYGEKADAKLYFNVQEPALEVNGRMELSDDLTERYLHGLFFYSLARVLEIDGAPVIDIKPNYCNRTWLESIAMHMINAANRVGAIFARGETPSFDLVYRLFSHVTPPNKYDEHREYVIFRRALLAIAQDLFLLSAARGNLSEVPPAELNRVIKSQHFSFSEWSELYVHKELHILTKESVESLLQSELQNASSAVSLFNERTEQYLGLCELALHQDAFSIATEALGKALNCVMGYGWRKEGSFAHVLDVIEAMEPVDVTFALNALRRIAPIMSRIGDMTEDDGVRESDLAPILLRLMPSSYVRFYEHLLVSSEWYLAELTFTALMKEISFEQPISELLACALWESRAVAELKKRADNGYEKAGDVVENSATQLGKSVGQLLNEEAGSSSNQERDGDIDPNMYGPSEFHQLLSEMKDKNIFTAAHDIARKWFVHWVDAGRGADVLQSIGTILTLARFPWEVAGLLDDVFELSMRLEGKKAAYKWLVAAQIQNHGWDAHYSEKQALKRFAVVASHYSDRWKEFIKDTAKSPYEYKMDALLIPHHRLVQFLIAVGQVETGRRVAEAMITSVIDDFIDQPLPVPKWLEVC